MGGKEGIRRQAVLVVIGDAINLSSGIILSMILARVIPPETMGTYRQIVYLGPLAVALVESGLSASVYRFWNALEESKRSSYAKMILIASLILGIAGTIALAALAPYLAHWYNNPDLKLALLVSAPYPIASIPLMLLRPVLLSQGYSLKATSLETIFSLISVSSLILPFYWGFSFLFALGCWTMASLLRLLAVPLILIRYLQFPTPWWDKGLFWEVWNYLWPMQVAKIPGLITGYLDKVVMSIFLSPYMFAVYSLGAREIPFIGTVGYSIGSVLIPHLVEDVEAGRVDQICRRWQLACEKTAIYTYLVASFCMWHAVPVMQFMFSSTYTESSIPFQVFAALTFLRVIEYASMAKAYGRSDLIMKSSFIASVAMALLSMPLAWAWGIFGMALTVFLANCIVVLYYLLQYRSLLKINISNFFPWKRLFVLFFISFASTAFIGFSLNNILILNNKSTLFVIGWKLSTLFILSAIVYFCLLKVFGFINIRK